MEEATSSKCFREQMNKLANGTVKLDLLQEEKVDGALPHRTVISPAWMTSNFSTYKNTLRKDGFYIGKGRFKT